MSMFDWIEGLFRPYHEGPSTNPETGLPMKGGSSISDVDGRPYGMSSGYGGMSTSSADDWGMLSASSTDSIGMSQDHYSSGSLIGSSSSYGPDSTSGGMGYDPFSN
ncbi:MAG: hypothetical protein WA979_02020 [Pacificimonas sp.]